MAQTEREYAEALFAIALEDMKVAEYVKSLEIINQVLKENPLYLEFMVSPAIPMSEKSACIDEAFGNDTPEHIISFLKILCENAKSRLLFACIEEFFKLAKEFENKAVAQIYSVVPLTDKQKESICLKLEKITNKGIDPIYIIDTSLIGGLKIEVDGKTFDGSIKHRLGEIKDVMNS